MIKQKIGNLYKKIRLAKKITGMTIHEFKKANSIDELLKKHTNKGICKICGKEGLIIKGIGLCVNCSVNSNKKIKKKFKKDAKQGICKVCGKEGLVTNKENLCFNCWIKKEGWIK